MADNETQMSDPWYASGGSGVLRLRYTDGRWIVVEPESTGETICLFSGEEPSSGKSDGRELTVAVETFRSGAGSTTNYLTVDWADEGEVTTSETDPTDRKQSEDRNTNAGYPDRNLTELRGDGEYVTVEATVDEIEYVAKNTPNTPDLKGVVREEGSTKRVPLVISDGVAHPHLAPSETVRFQGVKDHKYAKKNEVQLLVTDYTDFEKVD
jgi:hypothetical protein